MSFTPIDISSIDAEILRDVGFHFRNTQDSLAPLRFSKNHRDYNEYTALNRNLLYFSIEKLGGDGYLATRLVDNWINHPYRSTLRWAISTASNQNVDEELLRIQKRAYAIFVSTERHKLRQDCKYRPYETQSSCVGLIDVISDLDSVRKHKHLLTNYINKLKGLNVSDKFVLKSDAEILLQRQAVLLNDLQEMSAAVEEAKLKRVIATVRAMSALSQTQLPKEILVYRGICCNHGHEIYGKVKSTEGPFEVGSDHASSFTSCKSTAVSFANGLGMANKKTDYHEAVLISIKIPSYAVVAAPDVFQMLSGEDEIIGATDGTITMDKSNVSLVK